MDIFKKTFRKIYLIISVALLLRNPEINGLKDVFCYPQNLPHCRFCDSVFHVWRGLWWWHIKRVLFSSNTNICCPSPLSSTQCSPPSCFPPSFWIVFGFFLGLFNTFVFTGEKRTIELFHDTLIFHTPFINVIYWIDRVRWPGDGSKN